MKVFEKLPMELIDIILNYNGSIKRRNGVYINQIPRNDTRYELLKQLPTDAVNNMDIMEEIDDLKDYMNNDGENYEGDFYRFILMDIINKYDGLFTRMNGYDHILNIDLIYGLVLRILAIYGRVFMIIATKKAMNYNSNKKRLKSVKRPVARRV